MSEECRARNARARRGLVVSLSKLFQRPTKEYPRRFGRCVHVYLTRCFTVCIALRVARADYVESRASDETSLERASNLFTRPC